MTELTTFAQMMADAAPDANEVWHVDMGDNWLQGRTAFGGLSAALALRPLGQLAGKGKSLRSLTTTFVGPLGPGKATMTAEGLREGGSITQAEGRVLDADGNVATNVVAVFGRSRETLNVPPADHAAIGGPAHFRSSGLEGGRLPRFIDNFDTRWRGNGVPFSGSGDLELEMWVRHKVPAPEFPAEAMVALADVPPGVILAHYDRPAMLSSATWILDFLYPPEEIEGDWFHLNYHLLAAHGGYSHQSGRMYDEGGKLVALSHQCMVYFEPRS